MCRNIKVLRNHERHPTNEELEAAALQFVRKISGYPKLSKVNEEVFNKAVKDIALCSSNLFNNLHIK